MNIEKWIEENTDWLVCCEEGIQVVPVSGLRELLKTHAIVPRVASDEFCRGVDRQSCEYVSDKQVRTMLKFIIKAAEEEK